MVNKILNILGTGFLLLALYLRVSTGQGEPAYLYGLIGASIISITQWRIFRGL